MIPIAFLPATNPAHSPGLNIKHFLLVLPYICEYAHVKLNQSLYFFLSID